MEMANIHAHPILRRGRSSLFHTTLVTFYQTSLVLISRRKDRSYLTKKINSKFYLLNMNLNYLNIKIKKALNVRYWNIK
jgi:hypothetical protein